MICNHINHGINLLNGLQAVTAVVATATGVAVASAVGMSIGSALGGGVGVSMGSAVGGGSAGGAAGAASSPGGNTMGMISQAQFMNLCTQGAHQLRCRLVEAIFHVL